MWTLKNFGLTEVKKRKKCKKLILGEWAEALGIPNTWGLLIVWGPHVPWDPTAENSYRWKLPALKKDTAEKPTAVTFTAFQTAAKKP